MLDRRLLEALWALVLVDADAPTELRPYALRSLAYDGRLRGEAYVELRRGAQARTLDTLVAYDADGQPRLALDGLVLAPPDQLPPIDLDPQPATPQPATQEQSS